MPARPLIRWLALPAPLILIILPAVLLLSGQPTGASPGQTFRVSVDSAGNQGDSLSYHPAISGDGRYVAFASTASNLVAADTNGIGDVFVHDRGGAAVGGIAELPSLAEASAEQGTAPAEDSGWPPGGYAALAGLGAVAAAVIAVSGWYVRRRWLR
jgi:hypothetical protein